MKKTPTPKPPNHNNEVRSVSGYTGSGTKPLRIAANTFDEIRKKYEKEGTTDVYVRSPLNDETTFWFAGKLARRIDPNDNKLEGLSIPTESEAAISQKRLILEYAKNQLRPQNFGGPFGKDLELWLAPGDSEMDVVQNKVRAHLWGHILLHGNMMSAKKYYTLILCITGYCCLSEAQRQCS